ncbi:MAG: OstA-like protein, partial [Bacteroidales bacterium]
MQKFRFYLIAFLTLAIFLSGHQLLLAQRMRIQMNAGELRHSSSMGDMTRALNNPVFEHEGAYLYCDSAWLYEKSNTLECYGNVRIKSSDTLNLYGKFLHYDGNTKM